MLTSTERWQLAEIAKNMFLSNIDVLAIQHEEACDSSTDVQYKMVLIALIDIIVRREVMYRYAEEQETLKLWNWLFGTTKELLNSQGFAIKDIHKTTLPSGLKSVVVEAEH